MSQPVPKFTLGQLVAAIDGKWTGAQDALSVPIHGVAAIHDASPNTITWISDAKLGKHLASTAATAIIGTEALLAGSSKGIVISDPEFAIACVLDLLLVPSEPPGEGIHPSAVIHPTATLGDHVRVGACAVINAGARIGHHSIIHEGVSIGRDVHIGERCVLYDRAVIYDRSVVGNRVILHAGVVIGADGFGFLFREGKHRKIAHIGNVVIEDDVEIGPNSVVDRGKFGPTRIGCGTKIDALVMVGHNVQIGPLCVLAGQAGLSGSVRLGAGVALGGQVGISHGIAVGDQARIAAQSGVMADVPAGLTVFGTPAEESTAAMRAVARVRRLQKLHEEVAQLAGRVKALEASADDRKHG